MENLQAYGWAIASIAVYAILTNVLNAMVGVRKGALDMAPGSDFDPAGYDNPNWRLDRTYMNAVEMGGFYVAVVIAAILAGGPIFWVNLLAAGGLICRLLATVIYIRGIGKGYGGVRTGLAIVASILNVGLGVLAIAALL